MGGIAMKHKNALKVILPLIVIAIMIANFSYVYQVESEKIVRGESDINLSYRYLLQNDGPLNLSRISIRLAVMKTWEPFQKVNNFKANIEPNRTTTDEFENQFYWFEYNDFKVHQILDIKIDVDITLKFIDYTSIQPIQFSYNTSSEEYNRYMAFDSLTDPTDPRIINAANDLPKTSDIQSQAFEIYNFTASYLKYKLLSTSKGASFALTHGYGDCDEFQNLFIAMARASGIPAIGHTAWFTNFQDLIGSNITDDGAVAHAFPMFLLPGVGLVSADATRGQASIFDNWMKTDNQRIIMTRGPDQPYRLLNYKWVPIEGYDNPSLNSNYTIYIHSMDTKYFSAVRNLVLYEIVITPILFLFYSTYVGRKEKKKQEEKLDKMLDPSYQLKKDFIV